MDELKKSADPGPDQATASATPQSPSLTEIPAGSSSADPAEAPGTAPAEVSATTKAEVLKTAPAEVPVTQSENVATTDPADIPPIAPAEALRAAQAPLTEPAHIDPVSNFGS
jgi:hypothetical protein